MNVLANTAKQRPLSSYKAGMSVRVTGFEGGKCCRSRLLSMGIIPGTIVDIIGSNGRMNIRVRSSQFAIGCEMAKKIMAIPVCDCDKCSAF
ncbi:FeoA family protein [Desulfovibrio sp. JC010]|uniref:FeoA family protein n=1 Tax=Desulfovibrio sp. JC010 TaxID=2593641 RepID=UPI0013D7CEF3|nr:FeoA family protein [Desulfovibrio sp. JC010]NDV27600.1 ferrous iron transport protein A [Desulfovibrio sp. JC010]